MDMNIDRWKPKLFNDKEIDCVIDTIENVLFTDFFKKPNTYLSIHCGVDNNDAFDDVISAKYKLDDWNADIMNALSIDVMFENFYKVIEATSSPNHFAQVSIVPSANMLVASIGLLFDFGYVFVTVGEVEFDGIDEIYTLILGLAFSICYILEERDSEQVDQLAKSMVESEERIPKELIEVMRVQAKEFVESIQ